MAWAVSTACDKLVVSIVAMTSPALTWSPATAATLVTFPDAGKYIDFWLVFDTVPVYVKVLVKSPVVTWPST